MFINTVINLKTTKIYNSNLNKEEYAYFGTIRHPALYFSIPGLNLFSHCLLHYNNCSFKHIYNNIINYAFNSLTYFN